MHIFHTRGHRDARWQSYLQAELLQANKAHPSRRRGKERMKKTRKALKKKYKYVETNKDE